MHAWIATACLSIIPVEVVVEDRVETIELNHTFDDDGKPVCTQHIFRDRDGSIIDWRHVSNTAYGERGTGPCVRDIDRDCYRLDWSEGMTLRTVKAREFKETWTFYDPERWQHDHQLPREDRRELSSWRRKLAEPRKRTN